jgi:hypothetical protein
MTVIVAVVNETSVICAVQLPLGHPACCAGGWVSAAVTMLKKTVPFLISHSGIASTPDKVTVAGFCPGDSFPPWFVHIAVGVPVAVRVMTISPLPSPVRCLMLPALIRGQ